jgi:ElaB/YqjD/DUF883 family membrane-anchored ribosome-binding protein
MLVRRPSPDDEEISMTDTTGTDSGNEGTAGDAGSRFDRAREAMGEGYERAREAAGDGYEKASRKVRDGYNAARERVGEVDFEGMSNDVRTYVRSNPAKALLISVGIGFLIGLILRRDDKD